MRLQPLFLMASLVFAQEDHSQHKHAVAGLGTVEFPISCNAAAQKLMSRGIAMLHSFGYEEARLTFGEAAKADAACAMAHWGVARTLYHPIWAPPSKEELKAASIALDRALALDAKTDREKGYINAYAVFLKDWETAGHSTRAKNYEKALGELAAQNPKDDEAAIFHALQLVGIGYLDPTDKSYVWQKKGGEILNRVLARHPKHPGVAHYIIHSLDYPTTAEMALKAARAYSRIAPDSPHALHMPSHIFTRLGLWKDSVASNADAARSAVAQSMRLHQGGGSFDQLHALDYLVYANLQQAKDKSVKKAMAEMEALTRLDENQFAAAYAFAAIPSRWALERHDWKAAAALEVKPQWFPWQKFRNAEALLHYAKAIGAAKSGDLRTARLAANEIAAIRKLVPASNDYNWSGSIGAHWEAARALIAWAEGRKAEGLKSLREAADHEDAVDKHPVTPGALLPVREMLADLLLEQGEAVEALKEYQTVLKMAPRRFLSTAGAAKAATQAGDRAAARHYKDQLRQIAVRGEDSRPELAWALDYLGGN